MDDDGFTAHNREDRDYTAGLNFTFYDASERRLTAAARKAPHWMDKSTGFAQTDPCESGLQRTQISDFGLVLFTPDEIGRVHRRCGRFGAKVGQLQPIIREAWLGVVADLGDFRLSYTLRFQSAEIMEGEGARDLRWAGLAVSKRFN